MGIVYREELNVKGRDTMYKKHEKRLIWLAFIIAGIMLLSIVGRIF